MKQFVVVTGKGKKNLNYHRFAMMGMLLPMNRMNAKIDFVEYAVHSSPEIEAYYKKGQKFDKDSQLSKTTIDYFIKNYSYAKRDANSCIEWYAKESFFYKVLNIGLRTL